eukprot:990123-Amphidinium_carterae.1
MENHELFDRVPVAKMQGKLVKSQWLDELKRDKQNEPFVRSRLVAMEFNSYDRLDTFAGTPPLKVIKMIISRAASRRDRAGSQRRVLALYDVSVAFWHAAMPTDPEEAIAVQPPRGEEAHGIVWQLKRAMYGTRKASRLFQDHMSTVFKEGEYKRLVSCQQAYYNPESDSMAAIWGDDIIAE